ncbi:MAG: NAD(P)-dependent oxidoreductase [Pseudomonadota bacterium]|nr:NAD(P)-dependent oxidoreductase [Pseudomonadota bacterium]
MSEWVAVTGASGFIGRTICRLLHDEGWKVRALVRSEARTQALKGRVDDWVLGDLDDRVSLEKLTVNAFAVVHCAGAVRGASRQAFDRVNVDGVRNLIDAILASRQSPRLLCLSSLAAREPGLSFYAASKRKAEQLLGQQAQAFNWIALRPPAVYGPGDRELLPLFRFMAKGITPVLGNRDARFSMIYSQDIARLVQAWLLRDSCPSGVYSLHDGRQGGYSWSNLSATVSRLCQRPVREFAVPSIMLDVPARINRRLASWLGYAPMLTPEKLRELRHPDWVCDNEAIQKVLDWQPRVQLEEGLKRTPGWCPLLN